MKKGTVVQTVMLLVRLAILGAVSISLIEPGPLGVFVQQFLRVSIMFWIVVEVGRLFVNNVVRNTRFGAVSTNLLTSVFVIFIMMMSMEVVFSFIPQSHVAGYTFAAQNWLYYYWKTNSLGYRDKPVDEIDLQPPRILVVGDSYTAGYGVKNPDDTYVGQLRELVGDEFEVLNLGANNADSRDEFRNLVNYPYKPAIVVLQYYGNDVTKAANNVGITFHGFAPYEDIRGHPTYYLVRSSYILNYLYWRYPHGDTSSYVEFLNKAYNDADTMQTHLADLGKFVKYGRDCGVPLLVVIFPFLRDIESSRVYVDPVSEYFIREGVPVIDVGVIVRDIAPLDRVVNSNDGHPSELVHRRVAEVMRDRLAELGWLDPDRLRDATQRAACGADPAGE